MCACVCVWTWGGHGETLKKIVKMKTGVISRWIPPKLRMPFHGLYITCRVQYWAMILDGQCDDISIPWFHWWHLFSCTRKTEWLFQFTSHPREYQDLLGVTVALPYGLLFLLVHLDCSISHGTSSTSLLPSTRDNVSKTGARKHCLYPHKFLCKHLHFQFARGNQVFWRPLRSSSANCSSDDVNK